MVAVKLTLAFGPGLFFIVVLIVFVFLMRGGRNWARIVTVVLGGLYLLVVLLSLLAGYTTASGLASVLGLLQLLLFIGAIVTMFRPEANAWFRSPSPQL